MSMHEFTIKVEVDEDLLVRTPHWSASKKPDEWDAHDLIEAMDWGIVDPNALELTDYKALDPYGLTQAELQRKFRADHQRKEP